MSEGLLARKGEANPAAAHHGGESRFQARRVIILPSIALQHSDRHPGTRNRGMRHPALMTELPSPRTKRKKFTFRIEPDRHADFCAVADELGISRQKLLTQALDTFLATHLALLGRPTAR
jgi:hypothetical protein